MKTYSYKVTELPNVILPLGIQGENLTREIRIDFSAWLTDGSEGYPVIVVLTPNGNTYPAATSREDEEQEDGMHSTVVWPITSADTAEYGDGAVSLLLYGENGEILKSATARTSCAPTLLLGAGEAPEQFENWLQTITEKAAAASASRISAQESERDARQSAIAAKASEDAALAYAIAIREGDDPAVFDSLMNLATTMAVELRVTDWEEDEDAEDYYITLSNVIITEDTAATLSVDLVSAGHAQASIAMVTDEGTLTFRTAALPTGTITGTVILNGRFAREEEGEP